MADLSRLLTGLERYRDELQRHEQKVRSEFSGVSKRMSHLNSIYEGAAATEFKSHFARSQRSLNDYLEGTRRIQGVLDERIQKLREADRTGGL
jgi:uncharacterized protein YukE